MVHTYALGPTTAYCCDSGFNYTWVDGLACAAWGLKTEALPNPEDAKSDQVLMIHTPWTVTWYASDTAILTPKLPTLASLMIILTWTTGQTIPDGVYDYKPPRLESGPDFTKIVF
ncbi:hypothetical protein BDP55DRAFT_761689 [Colletotrichum godetiae]|uniref:Uncharacterized protein n=1 Tax=Colletotrichum godetiae TaxID=1209918 RepID=A0AAJ0EQH3_9PEZI|nr:uncharacterized protein BDP55DRAFT_761689 [Colletotrichum godetiae]KAK1657468.1 hypothetical protein BDP55DRAFT_761689 [Colletotrichum godetiae]